MSLCHLHVLITARTAGAASEGFWGESKPHHAAAPPSAGQGAAGAPWAGTGTQPSLAASSCVPHRSSAGGKARGNQMGQSITIFESTRLAHNDQFPTEKGGKKVQRRVFKAYSECYFNT